MQQYRIKQPGSFPVVAPLYMTTKMQKYTNTAYNKKHSSFLFYLMNIALIQGIVKGVWIIRRVLLFIYVLLSGKGLSRKRALERSEQRVRSVEQPRVVAIEQETVPVQPVNVEAELKDHFLVMASHELKTPMTTILGQSQLIQRRLSRLPETSSDIETIRMALERMADQTRRLNSIIEDLLDLHNIRDGHVALHIQRCDLLDICKEVVEDQRLLTGRTIELQVMSETIAVDVDRYRISQVIVNLVTNAVKYSPEDSPVIVRVERHNDTALIEVCDTGSGIAEEQQGRIFEPFYRVPEVQASAIYGLGLGLAICKDMVERHAGRIWCHSSLGKGSCFYVELPLPQTE